MPSADQLTLLEREAARCFAERVRSRFGERARSVRVFGSRARGEAHLHSDLDVLVLLDQMSWPERHEISDLGFDLMLERNLPFEIAPTVMTEDHFRWLLSLERLFPREVERDGISV